MRQLVTDVENILVSSDQYLCLSLNSRSNHKAVVSISNDLKVRRDWHLSHDIVQAQFFHEVCHDGFGDSKSLRQDALKLTEHFIRQHNIVFCKNMAKDVWGKATS